MLHRFGYEVVSASTGRAGIQTIRDCGEAFALAFIDIHLPDMPGTEVAQAVRRAAPQSLIVAATMDDDTTTMRAVYNAGCDVFLVKPYDILVLAQILQNVRPGRRWLADRNGLREYRGN